MPFCSQLPGSKHSAPSLLLRIPLPYPKGLPGYAKGMPTLCEGYAKGMPVDFSAKISTQNVATFKKNVQICNIEIPIQYTILNESKQINTDYIHKRTKRS